MSESEWEYAARAGTIGPFHFGDSISTGQANYNGTGAVAVGSFSGNDFGLHDMHGNAWRIAGMVITRATSDGSAWKRGGDGDFCVLRSGSWTNRPVALRSETRTRYIAWERYSVIGFRVARTLVP